MISGKYCSTSLNIYKISQNIFSQNNIFDALKTYINTFQQAKYYPTKFRKRTADRIIRSKYSLGCTDDALVARAILRVKDISTKYVETVQKEWLESGIDNINKSQIINHVFLDVYYKDEWLVLNPAWGLTLDNKYIFKNKEYVVLGKGVDFDHLIGDYGFLTTTNTEEIKKLVIDYVYKHKYYKY